ncbi:hypothetical protein [Lyngbya confervoides]|uniref:Replication restart DNA helicase PriA n=1 Tax=Lyngbya confervoides BDU141951 TaxID=1574623 RepID=A0ABD4T8B1_9CYAN|nr:hypothetical protein [Lyngbya confervoides]MCM1984821.1 hypothetical protein [Lyngbya confervoides BDU141951]
MQKTQIVHCPTCGSLAKRQLITIELASLPHREERPQCIRTECPHCDYLMVLCVCENQLTQVYAPITNLTRAVSSPQ